LINIICTSTRLAPRARIVTVTILKALSNVSSPWGDVGKILPRLPVISALASMRTMPNALLIAWWIAEQARVSGLRSHDPRVA
jgi:hypothetical protein